MWTNVEIQQKLYNQRNVAQNAILMYVCVDKSLDNLENQERTRKKNLKRTIGYLAL